MSSIFGKLRKRPQFLKVTANGRKWITPGFILQVRPHNREEINIVAYENVRVGYTVSKSVGNAVVRNRVKRRLRSLVSNVLLPYANYNMDCVLIGRKNAFDRPFEYMVSDMKIAFQKLGVLPVNHNFKKSKAIENNE